MSRKILCLAMCIVLTMSVVCVVSGCNNVVKSDTLYVKKVENLTDDFVMGMDASQVIALEASGVKYYNFNGKETDVFKILADNGINTIRVRVWNDPFDSEGHGYGGGNCTIDTAVEIGKRATKYGMSLMVDFHYSDFWADPSKQQAPKAWANMKLSEKMEALKQYTKECLTKLNDAGVKVNIIQVGNETNAKMCGETTWRGVAYLMNAGAEAIREVMPNALIAVHFANPEKVANFRNYASQLNNFSVDYDIFASSYYPYWHGTLENLSSILGEIATTYNKKVMVAETSYAFTSEDTDFSSNTIGANAETDYPFTVQGQANCIRDIIETVANTTNGMGVCYWEGTWISVGGATWEENSALWEQYGSGWASSYAAQYDPDDAGQYYGGCAVDNQAFFDKDGKVMESLKVWALVKSGNPITAAPDAFENARCSFILKDEITLPTTVNAIMTDNSKEPRPVTWNVTAAQLEEMKNGEAKQYTIEGTSEGSPVKCIVVMRENNMLLNSGFEEDDNEATEVTNWNVTGAKNTNDYKVLITNENPWEGTYAFHWWAQNGKVTFSLDQSATLPTDGTYRVSMKVMGSADATQNITIYAKVNGQIVGQASAVKDGYTSDPTKWQVATFEFDATGDTVVTIEITVNCADAGTWGDIDDVVLSRVDN